MSSFARTSPRAPETRRGDRRIGERELLELYDRHGADCWRVALVLARGNAWIAEQLVLGAFCEAARLARVEPTRTARTWLLCLVRRQAPRSTGG